MNTNGNSQWTTLPCLNVVNLSDSFMFLPLLKHLPAVANEEMRLRLAATDKCVWYHPTGNALHSAACRGVHKFGFKLVKVGSDTYNIHVTQKREKGLVLDLGAVASKPNGSKSQLWKVVPHPTMAEHGWVRIQNASNDQCLKDQYSSNGNMTTGACDGAYNYDAFEMEINDRIWQVLNEPYYTWN